MLPHVVASSARGKAGSTVTGERIAMEAIGVGGLGKKILEVLSDLLVSTRDAVLNWS